MKSAASENLYITLSFTQNLDRLQALKEILTLGKAEGVSNRFTPLVDPYSTSGPIRQFMYHSAFMDRLLADRERLSSLAAQGEPFYVGGMSPSSPNPDVHIECLF